MIALKTILYFSIFKYPIKIEEVYRFSDASKKTIKQEIDFLLKKGIIFKFKDFFTIHNDPTLVSRRLKGNDMAKKIMPKAHKTAKFIAKFPYVESVCLSGSLSKGYYDSDDDIDFFIITKPDRLWVSRTLLILYKKIFLLNSRKYFCVNYFISSDHLLISEQNRFTATEMVTLIPVYGKKAFAAFIQENKWPYIYFPNFSPFDSSLIKETKKSWLSLLLEKTFNTSLGDTIDTILRKITLKKWHSKFSNLESEDFKIAMKSTKHVSKHHPKNFQKKVIDRLNEEYDKLNQKYNLELIQDYA